MNVIIYIVLYIISYYLNRAIIKKYVCSWDTSDVIMNLFISLATLVSTLAVILVCIEEGDLEIKFPKWM